MSEELIVILLVLFLILDIAAVVFIEYYEAKKKNSRSFPDDDVLRYISRPAPRSPAQPIARNNVQAQPPAPAPRALPARQHSSPTNRTATRAAGTGPRGLKPEHFPACPWCKQRNRPGKQVIFWNSEGNFYSCSRGHHFKKNGQVIIN